MRYSLHITESTPHSFVVFLRGTSMEELEQKYHSGHVIFYLHLFFDPWSNIKPTFDTEVVF